MVVVVVMFLFRCWFLCFRVSLSFCVSSVSRAAHVSLPRGFLVRPCLVLIFPGVPVSPCSSCLCFLFFPLCVLLCVLCFTLIFKCFQFLIDVSQTFPVWCKSQTKILNRSKLLGCSPWEGPVGCRSFYLDRIVLFFFLPARYRINVHAALACGSCSFGPIAAPPWRPFTRGPRSDHFGNLCHSCARRRAHVYTLPSLSSI